MLTRFIVRTVTFIGLIFPAAFAVALLASPARPASLGQRACAEELAAPQGAATMSRALTKTGYGVNLCDAVE